MTGRWRFRELGWQVQYRSTLAVLSVLAGLRFVLVALALWVHRLHSTVALHGGVVADTLGATGYDESTQLDRDRYLRLVAQILNRPSPKDYHR